MKDNSGNRICYIKRNGLITGPFSIISLRARINTGRLRGDDLYSHDKITWERLDVLFPELAPPGTKTAAPRPVPAAAAVPAPAQTVPPVPQEQEEAGSEDDDWNSVEAIELQPLHPFLRFCCDTAVVFSSIWDFPQQFLRLEWNKKKTLWTGVCINLFWALLLVLLFGREYSSRFSYLFSPLMAIVSVLVAGLLSAGFAWSVEKICSKAARRTELNPDWHIFAFAVFMDSSIILHTFLALGHGITHPMQLAVFLFLLLVVSTVSCCGSSQMRFYLEHTASVKEEKILLVFPLYAAILSTVSYFLLKLI